MHATAADQDVPHAIKATEDDLLESIDFDEPHTSAHRPFRHAKVLLVEAPDGELAGMATYFFTFTAWLAKPGIILEDLYVVPEYRRRQYARLLLQELAKEGNRLGCERIEWMCFKENHRALRFYNSIGAKQMDTIAWMRMDKEAMLKLADE